MELYVKIRRAVNTLCRPATGARANQSPPKLPAFTGTAEVNNFHFSQAVIDPLIAIWSVGDGGVAVTFNFDSPFTILSQGAGHWGGSSLTQSGNSVTGIEGNGLLQLKGSYTDISFTTPNFENYYGIMAGVTAVPEHKSYIMLLAGLGLMSFIARRRKQNRAG